MAMKLCDGDYLPDGWGGFQTVYGEEELLNRVLFKLTAHRGGFAPMPELGSRLYMLGKVKPSEREGAARQYIAEALRDETGLEIDSIEILPEENGIYSIILRAVHNGEAAAINLTV